MTHPLTILLQDGSINEELNHLRNSHRVAIQEVESLLSTLSIENIVQAYRKLVEIYTLESGERAVEIRNIIAKICVEAMVS